MFETPARTSSGAAPPPAGAAPPRRASQRSLPEAALHSAQSNAHTKSWTSSVGKLDDEAAFGETAGGWPVRSSALRASQSAVGRRTARIARRPLLPSAV